MISTYTSLHNHSEYSSATLRFADAICKIPDSLNWCYENGLRGYAISDHQTVAGYVELEQAALSLNKDRPFQHIFGNEGYLIMRQEEQARVERDIKPNYWHYLTTVLDEEGLHQMYELSSRAWLRSYTYRGLLRRPWFPEDFEEVVGKNPGHIVASSACIGGFLPQCLLKKDYESAKKFIEWNQQVFGANNFFLECQPCYSDNAEQITVNRELWRLHETYGIPIIVTSDAHFQRPKDRKIHRALLLSKDGGDSREPEKFYQTTYLFTPKELRESLYNSSFTDEQIDTLFQTTNDIADRVQPFFLKKKTRVPALPSYPSFTIHHYFKAYYNKFPEFKRYAYSNNDHERYYFYQIEKGLYEYANTHDIDLEAYIAQINIEMEQVTGLGEIFGECMSDYFITVQKLIDIIWNEGDSLVGIGRGSAGAYVTNKLLGIAGIDPMLPEHHEFYPWWRFCSTARSDSIFDIDVDIQSFQKEKIIQAIKDYFGERRVCQCVAWARLSAKTALERAGRGLNISPDTIGYLKSLIPTVRGSVYSLKDCVYGNKAKGRETVREFIKEVNKYPDLLDIALGLEGLIVSSSVHAGALNILKSDFTETGSIMVSTNGAVISQYDLHHAEYCGDLKMDLLSIDALEMIRSCLNLLLKDGLIQWQGNLRETYNKYIGYDALEKVDKDMWSLLPNMSDAFQYDSRAGKLVLQKIGARNLTELSLANGLMRLAVPEGEQPIDKYVRYRNDINEWYKDMTEYGLTQEEQEIFKKHLGKYSGVLISQEQMMSILMAPEVCNFTMKESDKARKAVAKKSAEALAETEERLYRKGKECGRSQKFLDYLWRVQIEMSKSYSFNLIHSHEYSTECLQELNLYWRFPKIYWNTATIIVRSGTEDKRENNSKAIDYGKISKSIYNAQENGLIINHPSINKSNETFTPNIDTNSIVVGLSCISTINQDITQQIISNRPYSSFQDFFNKNTFDGTLITKSKFISLIKAGCFDEFGKSRNDTMKEYIKLLIQVPSKLTMANLPKALEMKVHVPRELIVPYRFLKYVCSPKFFYSKHPNFKSKKIYWLDNKAQRYFAKNCQDGLEEGIDWFREEDRILVIDKNIKKFFKPTLNQLQSYINSDEFKKEYTKRLYQITYNELVKNNNINHWSLETCSYYSNEHELANIDKEQYLIDSFNDLPSVPKFITKKIRGREWKQYELSRIAGVVLDRNDAHHTLTILDSSNTVVQAKFNAQAYSFFKQQISENGKVVDPSWFKRGTLLILTGYRIGDNDFRVKRYKSSIFRQEVMKITNVENTGELDIQSYRYGFEDNE